MSITINKPAINVREVLATIPKKEKERTGFNDYLGVTGAGGAGNPSPSTTTYTIDGVDFRLPKWIIGDNVTLDIHVLHGFIKDTLIFPHIHWQAMTAAPDTSQVVQFDVSIMVGAPHSQAAFDTVTTISLVDSPTGFNFNEIIEATDVQAIAASRACDADSVIRVLVTRVTPSAGVSYTGDVVMTFMDMHVEDDMVLTTTKSPIDGQWVKSDVY